MTAYVSIFDTLCEIDENGKKFVSFDSGWNYLKTNSISNLYSYYRCENIIESQMMEKSFLTCIQYANIYSFMYHLCNQSGYPARLYEMQNESMKEFYMENAEYLLSKQDDVDFMNTFMLYYEKHKTFLVKWWFRYFAYFEHSFMFHQKNKKLEDQLNFQFYEFFYLPLQNRIFSIISNSWNRERDNPLQRDIMLRHWISFFKNFSYIQNGINFHIYDLLHSFMLNQSKEYYQKNVFEWKHSRTNLEYCSFIYDFRKMEKQRMELYLFESSFVKLDNVFVKETLVKMLREILENKQDGIPILLEQKNYDDIKKIFELMLIIPNDEGTEQFSNILNKHIEDIFLENVSHLLSTTDAKEVNQVLISKLMELVSQYFDILETKLNNHFMVSKKFHEILKNVFNQKYPNWEYSTQFCIFIDNMMKTSNYEDSVSIFNILIKMIAYIFEKDVFLESYRHYLSRRLLMNKVKDMEMELYFISKLKEQFGIQSTFKMEGMVHDYNRCKDDVDSYGTNHPFPFVFQPATYTFGNWPVLPNTELRIPPCLQECMQHYDEFYTSRNTMRKLTWIFTYGTIHISVNYPKRKTFDFMMNILQFVVFHVFMGNLREFSFQEILEKTCMNENYLKKVLHSLSCNKLKLLVKTPESNSISNQDTFRFFTDFHSPKRLNVIPSPPFEEVSVHKKVEEDRTHIIDAVVVRIMKTRRTLSHQELISSVVSQLILFKPTIMDIKRRIENLIERDYLERDRNNAQMYRYVA